MSLQTRIVCGFPWDEGLGNSCRCTVLLPTDNATQEHYGPHICECGKTHGVDQTVEEETPAEISAQRLRRIKSLLHMDPTRHGAVPTYQSANFQTVMQTALLLSIAESLHVLIGILDEE